MEDVSGKGNPIMIKLRDDCLIIRLPSGEGVPCSADMIAVEIVGDTPSPLDPELLRTAARSAFDFFREEQGREEVTIAEFSTRLEKELREQGMTIHASPANLQSVTQDPSTDLLALTRATASDASLELEFFPRLRDKLREQLGSQHPVVAFTRLRPCVKQIVGAKRWDKRCETMQGEIVEYLRQCMAAEPNGKDRSMMVR